MWATEINDLGLQLLGSKGMLQTEWPEHARAQQNGPESDSNLSLKTSRWAVFLWISFDIALPLLLSHMHYAKDSTAFYSSPFSKWSCILLGFQIKNIYFSKYIFVSIWRKKFLIFDQHSRMFFVGKTSQHLEPNPTRWKLLWERI